MTGKVAERRLAADLARLLAPRFPGIAVQAGEHERWDRPCVTFRWAGFADLLPEERFHRLIQAVPEAFRTDRLGGFVWLELAPHETVEAFLNLPRSEDVAGFEASILSGLVEVGFFDSLAESLGPSSDNTCPGDFSASAAVLVDKGCSAMEIQSAKLVFIRHGAYCDCQVLHSVRPALTELLAGAA